MTNSLSTLQIAADAETNAPPEFAFHPSGEQLAVSQLRDGHIALVDCESGRVTNVLLAPNSLYALVFDSSGEYLVGITSDHICTWHLTERNPTAKCADLDGDFDVDSWPATLWPTKQGVWVVLSNSWQLWSPARLTRLVRHAFPSGEILICVGRRLDGIDPVVITHDVLGRAHPVGTICAWKAENQELLCSLVLNYISDLIVSNDVSISVSRDPKDKASFDVWNLFSGSHIRKISGTPPTLDSGFCGDSHVLVSTIPEDGDVPWTNICITDTSSGKQTFLDPAVPFRPKVVCSPFARMFATMVNDSRHAVDVTSFWDLERRVEIGRSQGHMGNPSVARFSPCSRWFVSAVKADASELMVRPLVGGGIAITDIRGFVK